MNNEDLHAINKTSPNLLEERLAELKRLFPDLFDGNGNLDEKELKDLLSSYTTPQVEKFTFEWGGKSASKKIAFSPSKATLVPDKERSLDFDNTQNMIIEGDNLHVLKLLQASYANKIKCIYIDPPYNTGKNFIYPDNYRETEREYWEKNGQVHDGVKLDSNFETNGRLHSSWLSMMQSRLLLARRLLKDDGVIFVSIDDHEVHNLRKLMDEVFGEENFVSNIIWYKKYAASNDTKGIAEMHENILCYSKADSFERKLLPRTEKQDNLYKYDDNDGNGLWRSDNLSVKTFSKAYYYPIINPNTGKEYFPPQGRCWITNESTIKEWVDENRVFFGKDGKGAPQLKRYLGEVQQGVVPLSIWSYDEVGHTDEARKELKNIFENPPFDNPKPTRLIKRIMELSMEESDTILDFFAGSGTTGHAVMELNKEDGGNRKFILVQIPEYIDENSEAYTAGYKTISDITIERVKRAGEKIAKENDKVDTGFRVFKQIYSHFPENTWKPDPNKSSEENQQSFKEYLARAKATSLKLFDDFEFEHILYEILSKQGFELTFEIQKAEQFKKNEVHKVKDSEKETLICLDKELAQETVDELLVNHINNRFICIENALDTSKKWKLSKALGKNLEVIS